MLEMQGEVSSPRVPRKWCNPANTWILAQWHPCWTSDLQNCKVVSLHCFKPPKWATDMGICHGSHRKIIHTLRTGVGSHPDIVGSPNFNVWKALLASPLNPAARPHGSTSGELLPHPWCEYDDLEANVDPCAHFCWGWVCWIPVLREEKQHRILFAEGGTPNEAIVSPPPISEWIHWNNVQCLKISELESSRWKAFLLPSFLTDIIMSL